MFSDRIKELRERSGLTLTDFAKSIGASTDTIRKYEAGDVTPRKKTVEKICEVYGVTEKWLMDEKPELVVEAEVISEEQEPAPEIPVGNENSTPVEMRFTLSGSQPLMPPIPPALGLFLFHQAVRHQFKKSIMRRRW